MSVNPSSVVETIFPGTTTFSHIALKQAFKIESFISLKAKLIFLIQLKIMYLFRASVSDYLQVY